MSLVVTRNNSDTAKAELLVEMVAGLFLPFIDALLSCIISCVKVSSLLTERGKDAQYRINKGIYFLILAMCKAVPQPNA